MKTITRKALGWGSALVLVAGLTSSAFAGPGPQFWAQRERDRELAKNSQATPADVAKPANAVAMACPACRTSDVTEYRGSAAGGKVAARYDQVGTKHSCSACGGAITTTRGNTTNDMKANCPICAKAQAASATCCTTS